VAALYAAAGLNLDSDLNVLDGGARIKADPAAAAYLARYITFDGQLSVPMLTMHTTGDGLVIPPNESAYYQVVFAANHQDMLRQVFVHRAGHCIFTEGETIAALQVLLDRLDSGHWNDSKLLSTALNSSALAQGKTANEFFGLSVPPSFLTFNPGPYPRPYAKGELIPT
jgi:hypothetical protein